MLHVAGKWPHVGLRDDVEGSASTRPQTGKHALRRAAHLHVGRSGVTPNHTAAFAVELERTFKEAIEYRKKMDLIWSDTAPDGMSPSLGSTQHSPKRQLYSVDRGLSPSLGSHQEEKLSRIFTAVTT